MTRPDEQTYLVDSGTDSEGQGAEQGTNTISNVAPCCGAAAAGAAADRKGH